MNPVLEAALTYRQQHGLALLPLQPRSKEPHFAVLESVHGTPRWDALRQRPASPPEIRAWFAHDPALNLGIITGSASGGLVVADFDRRPGGRLIETPIVQTGRGLHVYLHSSAPLPSSKPKSFELKAESSYVVAPPSLHPSGKSYHWQLALPGLGGLFVPEASLAPVQEFAPLHDCLPLDLEGRGEGNVEVNLYFCDPLEGVAEPGDLRAWDAREDFVLAATQVCGIPRLPLGRTFRCVLPGHEERKPSASLYREPRHSTIVYRDWHRGDQFFTLTEIYAARTSGEVRKLRGIEHAVWKLRLLVETGFLTPATVALPVLPADAPSEVVRWWAGYRLLLACRWVNAPGEPVPFTPDFAVRWCGLTRSQALKARAWLVKHGFLKKAGRHGLMNLWLPLSPTPKEQTR